VRIHEGVRTELHLCAACAQAAGFDVPAAAEPVIQMIKKVAISAAAAGTRSEKACPTCGATLADIRKAGLLGCPDCYEAFVEHLEATIERAHGGRTAHCGKCPRRRGLSIDRERRLKQITRELEEAVAAEQYERAARLRDELRGLNTP